MFHKTSNLQGVITIKKKIFALLSVSLTLSACTSVSEPQSSEISEPVVEDQSKKMTRELSTTIIEDTEVKLSFYGVGDNLIHSEIIDYAQIEEDAFNFKPIYQNITDDIQTADLSFINQESIIGGDDLGYTGYPTFNTPSDMVINLVDLGFNIISGSNNHSLDLGTSGIENTLKYWGDYQNDILFTGVFDSQESRDTTDIIEVDGMKFAILTYTYGTNSIEPEFSYLVNYFDSELISEDVQKAKEISDFVIVSAHWGDEHTLAPNQMQVEYAKLFADLEVDLVLGTHSHTIQPVEWMKGTNGNETLVIYSLGNLVASSTSDINMLGGSISLDFIQDGEEHYIDNVKFIPLVIHYETAIEGDIDSRTNFEIFKLSEYSEELANEHALNFFEDNLVSPSNYKKIVQEVIHDDFLK